MSGRSVYREHSRTANRNFDEQWLFYHWCRSSPDTRLDRAPRWGHRAVSNVPRRNGKVGKTPEGLPGNLARYTVTTAAVLIVLAEFGVQKGSLIAVFIVAGKAV